MSTGRRKFNRKTDQRSALMTGLLVQLIEHGSITTTFERAKDVKPKIDKLITEAKKGTLAARRRVISALDNNVTAGHRLMDVLATSFSSRNSGYVRVARAGQRKGDNAMMGKISFVDEVVETPTTVEAEPKKNSNKTAK